jgi:hypothetical protein
MFIRWVPITTNHEEHVSSALTIVTKTTDKINSMVPSVKQIEKIVYNTSPGGGVW